MTLLRVQNLSVSIGGTDILHDVDLSVTAGQITAITGESGSGKSMTALACMGLLPKGARAAGTIDLAGTDILQTSERQLNDIRGNDIGMVFQEPMTALNPVQTIGTQVAETIRIHTDAPRTEAKTRAADMLRKVGLDVSPDRYPHEVSGGQRQRVVIAMAIALRPELLIADEPTTALDVTTQARILDLLKGLVAEFGMGMILITHDLAVVSDIADQIAVMQHGRVVEAGATDTLMRRMQHSYTRSLFAASSHVPAIRQPYASHTQTIPHGAAAPKQGLAVENVTKKYNLSRKTLLGPRPTFAALKNVSLTISSGERVGLVGESGCGKSTLTRAILGLEDVQAGSITLDGAPVVSNRRADLTQRRKMQVVFQDPYGSFNPRHTVARLVSEPFYLLEDKPKNPADRIAQALTDVGLSPSDGDKYIHEFSGGQRQRIAIARALITDPQLVIFDEAVSALDVSVRAQVLDLIADISARRSLSYLFISHDLSVVRAITDRVLVMKGGQIVEDGATEDVYRNPSHPYTQTLLAAAPQLPEFIEV
ncbi:ABC transporter ATP-binding protein [Pseudooctadecabacter jejudonensis]|uniref:Glutathione import ATP-binding protein GsiA n=1 Tax=Pseudooctadecabacter jejudonensis TaxID=1391910 RepID=A0A1Y5SVJ7_9RHOB|nr:ABC transporter ATP-binding protein [Pseudooctadecabacter jejudonensis]SLN49003.1 Glutathione import ATP-binding protein GsiA [Pseudooctadecabacter jejudonensis]